MNQIDYKWVGKPDYRSFLMQQLILQAINVIMVLCFYGFNYYLIQGTSETVLSWKLLHFVFAFVFLTQAYPSGKKLLGYKYLLYRITDDRVEIIKGKNQEDFKSIAKDKIQYLHTKKSLADRIYGTKTIQLFSGEITDANDEPKKKFDELENIKDDKDLMLLLKSSEQLQ